MVDPAALLIDFALTSNAEYHRCKDRHDNLIDAVQRSSEAP